MALLCKMDRKSRVVVRNMLRLLYLAKDGRSHGSYVAGTLFEHDDGDTSLEAGYGAGEIQSLRFSIKLPTRSRGDRPAGPCHASCNC